MSAFADFKKNLLEAGLEYFGLYYGTYAGIVVSNDDPEKRHRIKIACPEVWGEDESVDVWVLPRGSFLGKKIGLHAPPQKDDVVWVTFRGGNAKKPLWEYGWQPEKSAIPEADKDIYVFRTPKGHVLVFDEKNSKLYLNYKDGKGIVITKDKINIGKMGGTQEKSTLGETTKKKLEDICDKAKSACEKAAQIQVPTAMGTSGVPTNAGDFVQLASDFASIKSSLGDILSDVMTNE